MKYKVMIVEDEVIEREATVLRIRLSCPDVEVVCSAENGEDALKLFRIHLPQIVVMDVDLPGMSGLELIQEMQQISPYTQYIILSAYNLFSYAQKALKLGVHEYLLKPCKTQELEDAINSIINIIEESHSPSNDKNALREKIDTIRPILESECVFSIVSMRENISLTKMFDFLGINTQSGFVFVIKSEIGQHKILSSVKASMESMGINCISEILNGLCVFVALNERLFTNEQIEELMHYLAMLLERSALKCYIGVGRCCDSSDDLRKSYEEALHALSYAHTHQSAYIVFHEAIIGDMSMSFDVQLAVKRIHSQLVINNEDGIRREVKDTFASLMLLGASRDTINSLIYRMYVQILSLWDGPISEEAFASFTIEDIHNETNLCVISDKIIQQFVRLAHSKDNNNIVTNSRDIAAEVMDYIREHYPENVSLNQTAEHFAITPFYLSKLVKRHTGKSFTDYLTSYRISKAKSFIQQGELSIKEVTYAVGFNSQNYFTKVFKKYTGFTPSEFRTQKINE